MNCFYCDSDVWWNNDFDTEDIPDYYPDTFRSTYDGSIETNRGRVV